MNAALSLLDEATAARDAPPARWWADGRPVVAHLGADVPREVIAACGAVPVRLFVRAGGAGEAADALGPGVDPALIGVVDDIVTRATGAPVVIDHSAADHLRAWQIVGWLRHNHGDCVDDVHFLDLLHLDRPPTRTYNRCRIEAFVEQVAAWTGTRPTDDQLAAAVREEDERRRLLAEVVALRSAPNPRLTGSQALSIVRAGWVLPAADHSRLMEQLLTDLEAPPPGGPIDGPTYGSTSFDAEARRDRAAAMAGRRAVFVGRAPLGDYAGLEAAGVHVVGEEHDEGGRIAATPNGGTGDAFDTFVARHHAAPQSVSRLDPATRLDAIEAIIESLHADLVVLNNADTATRWLFPAIERLASAANCEVERWRENDPRRGGH